MPRSLKASYRLLNGDHVRLVPGREQDRGRDFVRRREAVRRDRLQHQLFNFSLPRSGSKAERPYVDIKPSSAVKRRLENQAAALGWWRSGILPGDIQSRDTGPLTLASQRTIGDQMAVLFYHSHWKPSCAPFRTNTGMVSIGASAVTVWPPAYSAPVRASIQSQPCGR